MSGEGNKALVRRWMEAVDRADAAAVQQFIAPSYVDHNPPPFPGHAPGIEGVTNAFNYALGAFSEFHHTIEDQLSDGDKVVTRITGWGRHTGEFLGIPPTGKEVSMQGIAIHRIADGQLVEHWAQIDALGLLQQLGAVPAPEAAAPGV